MKTKLISYRLHWINLPGAILLMLLQRTPLARVATAVETAVVGSPIAAILRSMFAASATLGSVHALAGATTLVTNDESPLEITVGVPIAPVAFGTAGTTSQPDSWTISGSIPPGLSFSGRTTPGTVTMPEFPGMTLTGTPTQAGTFDVGLQAHDVIGVSTETFNYRIIVTGGVAVAPSITSQPSHQVVAVGGTANFSVAASGTDLTYQWQRNGTNVGGNSSTLTIANAQPGDVGFYHVTVSNGSGSVASSAAVLGLTSTTKLVGPGTEFPDIPHQNGNIFDQILIEGPAVTVTADASQVLRASYVDEKNEDIVQVEFSGPGTLSISLEGPNSATKATAAKYNQPNTQYVRGHATIVVTGATELTNLTVFSVGRGTAVNQGLFRGDVTYDGLADIAAVAILSANGQFGGMRGANARYTNDKGLTGLYAAGVDFSNRPCFTADIDASGTATPVLMIGAGSNVRITGGDLQQANGRPVQVAGLSQLLFSDGTTSHYIVSAPDPSQFLNAQSNKGQLEQNGVNVTTQVVVNP